MHYGVMGMKWGVRRYQNKDGTRTSAGKKHDVRLRRASSAKKTNAQANDIVDSLSAKDKVFLGADDEPWIRKDDEVQQSMNIAKRFVETDPVSKTPVSFFEIWDYQDPSKPGQTALATRNDPQYRNKGYATRAVKRGMDWYNRYGYKQISSLEWIVHKDNAGSIALAKKFGLKLDSFEAVHPEWSEDQVKNYQIYTYRKH